MPAPLVSFVLATHNRREIALATLARLRALPDEVASETFVVDNASDDGTAEAIRRQFPQVKLMALKHNRGSCAKAFAATRAAAPFVVFLDDDSYPQPGSVSAMLRHFAEHSRLGAAGFHVHLPDGRQECSAFPDVFIGCGVGLRRAALEEVGGLDPSFFMQAEEYDLSFRLVNAGWEFCAFPNMHVEHLKTPTARLSARTVYYDTRNNLRLIDRYLSLPAASIYYADWTQRYRWIAGANGYLSAYWKARMTAACQAGNQRRRYARRRLTPAAFEQLFRWQYVTERMQALYNAGVREVLLADMGKNIYPFVAAAYAAGIRPVAIADDRFAAPQRRYRSVPILPVTEALGKGYEAVVVSNTSPVHADAAARRLANLTQVPLHNWFGGPPASGKRPGEAGIAGVRQTPVPAG
jgi:GT2 family glycosyltransferase